MSQIFTPEALAFGVACGALFAVIRAVWPFAVKVVRAVDDFAGTPARPGVEARPGVMERQAMDRALLAEDRALLAEAIERLAKIETAADTAVYNTQPNGGGSPHDSLVRQIGAVGDALAVHLEQSKTWVREVDRTLDGYGIDTPPWPTDNP